MSDNKVRYCYKCVSMAMHVISQIIIPQQKADQRLLKEGDIAEFAKLVERAKRAKNRQRLKRLACERERGRALTEKNLMVTELDYDAPRKHGVRVDPAIRNQ